MGNLLIRDVEDTLVQRLKLKAETNGTSLQYEASLALKRGAPLTGIERRAILERFEREHGFPKVVTTGAEMIRAVRDGDEGEQ
jgi:plasmid stability protein